MNKSVFSFSISIDDNKKRKKVHHKRRGRKKEEKNGLNKKKKPRNHQPLIKVKPATSARALQLFQETLTLPRRLTTMLQNQRLFQPQLTKWK